MNRDVIDDIFGTEEEVRNIMRRKLPDYLTTNIQQPRLYIIIEDNKTNQESLYILKPKLKNNNHRGTEAIKTFSINPSYTTKTNKNYLQLDKLKENKNYQNCA